MKKKILSLMALFGCTLNSLTNVHSYAEDGKILNMGDELNELTEEARLKVLISTLEIALLNYVDTVSVNVLPNGSTTDRVEIIFDKFIGNIVEKKIFIDIKDLNWESSLKWSFREFIIDNIIDVVGRALNYKEMLKYKHIFVTSEQKTHGDFDCVFANLVIPRLNDDNFPLILDKVTEKPVIILKHKIKESINKALANGIEEKRVITETKIKNPYMPRHDVALYDSASSRIFLTVSRFLDRFYKKAFFKLNGNKIHIEFKEDVPIIFRYRYDKSKFHNSVDININCDVLNNEGDLEKLITNELILKLLSAIENFDCEKERKDKNVPPCFYYFKDVVKKEWYAKRNSDDNSIIDDLSEHFSIRIFKRLNNELKQ